MNSSSNLTSDRIKQLAKVYAAPAQKEMLDVLRQKYGLLEAQHKVTVEQNEELKTRVDLYMSDLSIILDFIRSCDVELPAAVADVIGRQEELRICRRLQEEITGKSRSGMLHHRGKP